MVLRVPFSLRCLPVDSAIDATAGMLCFFQSLSPHTSGVPVAGKALEVTGCRIDLHTARWGQTHLSALYFSATCHRPVTSGGQETLRV